MKLNAKFRAIVAIAMMFIVGFRANAFNVDGIYYNITSSVEPYTVEVTSSTNSKYSGEIVIPESVSYGGVEYSVTSIGERAFGSYTGLTSIEIPNSVTSIGNYAFSDCDGLTSIEIPNSVTSIGNYAFDGCSGLTSIEIPNSATSIGYAVFSNCSGLTSVIVEEGNSVYDSRENCNAIIETATNKLINGFKNSFIPNSVTSIGNYAFSRCKGLTSIEIPNSVTSIGSSAFSSCKGLTSVTIGNSVTSIGNNAFSFCSGLTSIEIPNSVTSIGSSAFYSCSGLTSIEIPNSVTSIGNSAFYSCSGLTSVTIGNSVTAIGDHAFSGCKGLTSIEIPDSVTSIGIYAFSSCYGLTSIEIPNSVTSIGRSAFGSCSGLTNVVWNAIDCKDFDYFSDGPFYDSNENITSFTFGDAVQHIPAYLCYYMSKLSSIEIPNSVTSIGDGAFSGCLGLTSIEIPNSVTSIGNSVFSYCSGLTSIEIPNLVTSIGNYTFQNCLGLTSIEIPNSVTSIGNWAFGGCSSLTSIEIPNSVTSISSSAFDSCSGLTSVVWNAIDCKDFAYFSHGPFYEILYWITSFTFGDAVEHIPAYLCCGMSKLTTIEIPNSVTSIGNYAFSDCDGLTEIRSIAHIPPTINSSTLSDVDKSIPLYVPYGCKSAYQSAEYWNGFTNIIEMEPEVVVAESITLDQNEISLNIAETSELIATILPEETTNKTVAWTSSDESVATVGENGLVTAIAAGEAIITATTQDGSNLSATCKVTVNRVIPEVGTMFEYDCLTYEVTVKGKEVAVTTSQSGEYSGDIIIPESVVYNEISYSVTSIRERAFTYEWLTSVTIGNSITSIGEEAFFECTNLKSVTIGNSVTAIGDHAFSGCYNLEKIKCLGTTPPEVAENAFDNYSAYLYVPEEGLDAYADHAVWSQFTINEPEGVILTIISARGNGAVQMYVPIESSHSFKFEADDNYVLHSIMLNGEDVTEEIDARGVYTTPQLRDNTTLNVAFEIVVDIDEVVASDRVRVTANGGRIIVDGTVSGELVNLYTDGGVQVNSVYSNGDRIEFEAMKGKVYIVKTLNRTVKVMM